MKFVPITVNDAVIVAPAAVTSVKLAAFVGVIDVMTDVAGEAAA